jgi:hypothetical protein
MFEWKGFSASGELGLTLSPPLRGEGGEPAKRASRVRGE